MTPVEYLDQVRRLLDAVDVATIERVIDLLADAQRRDAAVFVVGNGGSASTSAHFATDLLNAARRAGPIRFRVFSLTDNSAALTATANDEGYDLVFAAPLENYVRMGDVVIAISASGNSPNVLKAVDASKARGAHTVALVGFNGGQLDGLAEISLLVRSPMGAYGPVEDLHMMLQHVISNCLATRWAAGQYPIKKVV